MFKKILISLLVLVAVCVNLVKAEGDCGKCPHAVVSEATPVEKAEKVIASMVVAAASDANITFQRDGLTPEESTDDESADVNDNTTGKKAEADDAETAIEGDDESKPDEDKVASCSDETIEKQHEYKDEPKIQKKPKKGKKGESELKNRKKRDTKGAKRAQGSAKIESPIKSGTKTKEQSSKGQYRKGRDTKKGKNYNSESDRSKSKNNKNNERKSKK